LDQPPVQQPRSTPKSHFQHTVPSLSPKMTAEHSIDTPTTMRALVTTGEGRPAAVKSVPVPQAGVGELLVKVAAVALNPTDWMHAVNQEGGRILGVDFAGIVIAAGVETQNFKPGDRIAGFVHGGQYEDRGSMAEFLVADAKLVWRIPDGKSFEEASTMNCGYVSN
jgi:NADPH:quinone reductase-like Zn-dependent oxidoreductase